MNPQKLIKKYKDRREIKDEGLNCIKTLDKFAQPDDPVIVRIIIRRILIE